MSRPIHLQKMKLHNKLTHKVCVLLEDEARQHVHAGFTAQCSSGRHRHYKRNRAEELVKTGHAQWIGSGKNKIQFLQARTWQKIYTRNDAGEVFVANMQLAPGAAAF
jgi:hypothetical protein